MNSPTNHTVYELLVNEDFINYVIQPTLILREMWNIYFDTHPEIIPSAIEAKKILLGETITASLSTTESHEIEKQLFEKCGLSVA